MNVLVVMYDSLRPDYLGCLGNEKVKTPNFDAFAMESCVFEQAVAEFPITIPSRTALVTGKYTFTNRPWCALRDDDVSVAQILQQSGWLTAAISDSPFNPGSGMNRGMCEFIRIPGGKCHEPIVEFKMPDISGVHIPEGSSKKDVRFYMCTVLNRAEYLRREGIYLPDILTREALKWLEANRHESFFLWLDYFDPHEPWDPPEPYASMYDPGYPGKIIPMPKGPDTDYLSEAELNNIRAQYAGCVTQVDDQFGKLCARLKELDLWDKTIVVLLSDHGEPFGEHGQIRKFRVPVYDELARIVFMMRVPGVPPRRIRGLAQNTDMLPTLLSILGIPVEHPIDGVDLSPLIHGDSEEVRTRAYSGGFQIRSSIWTQEWKFIDNRGEGPNELFNRIHDPGEKENLLAKEEKLAAELHRELFDWHLKWSGVLSWRGKPWRGEDLTTLD